MSRPVVPTKVCPNCHLLHARWGGNCMERMQEEIAMLRAELEAAREPTPSHADPLCPEHAIRLPCPACAAREDA